MSAAFAVAQLRHLYQQMVGGDVHDTDAAARGLLGPAIADLERTFESDAAAELRDLRAFAAAVTRHVLDNPTRYAGAHPIAEALRLFCAQRGE